MFARTFLFHVSATVYSRSHEAFLLYTLSLGPIPIIFIWQFRTTQRDRNLSKFRWYSGVENLLHTRGIERLARSIGRRSEGRNRARLEYMYIYLKNSSVEIPGRNVTPGWKNCAEQRPILPDPVRNSFILKPRAYPLPSSVYISSGERRSREFTADLITD